MAWNPSPKVADCREIARKWGHKHQVIILAVDRDKGTLQLATYGETKALCADAKRLGEMAYQTIFDNYDPDVPMTAAPDENTGTRCLVCGGPFNPANKDSTSA